MGTEQSIWAVLLPVIIGGSLTMLGTAFGPLVSFWWNERLDKQRKAEQRLEALLVSLYDFDQWLDEKCKEWILGAPAPIIRSPLTQVKLIVATSFPALSLALLKFQSSAKEYEIWAIEKGQTRIANNIINSDGIKDVYLKYAASLGDFEKAITEHGLSIGAISNIQAKT